MITYASIDYSHTGKLNGRKTNAAFMGFPSDLGSTKRSGQSSAPGHVRYYSHMDSGIYPDVSGLQMKSFSGTICDAGDVVPSTRNLAEYLADVADNVEEVSKNTGTLIGIGGDDSVCYGFVEGLHRNHGRLGLVHYDAHTDTYGELEDPLDHGNWVSRVSKDFNISITQRFCREVSDRPSLTDDLSGLPIVVALDMDAFDPSAAPGVGFPVPFGPTSRELIEDMALFVRGIKVVGVCITELVPDRDQNGITAILASNVINRILMLLHS